MTNIISILCMERENIRVQISYVHSNSQIHIKLKWKKECNALYRLTGDIYNVNVMSLDLLIKWNSCRYKLLLVSSILCGCRHLCYIIDAFNLFYVKNSHLFVQFFVLEGYLLLVTGVQNWKIKKCRKSKSRDINNINVIYVSGKSDESK